MVSRTSHFLDLIDHSSINQSVSPAPSKEKERHGWPGEKEGSISFLSFPLLFSFSPYFYLLFTVSTGFISGTCMR